MKLELRKFVKFVDKTFIEGGKEAKEPVLLVSVAAIFKNPWHGQGFVENLRPKCVLSLGLPKPKSRFYVKTSKFKYFCGS